MGSQGRHPSHVPKVAVQKFKLQRPGCSALSSASTKGRSEHLGKRTHARTHALSQQLPQGYGWIDGWTC